MGDIPRIVKRGADHYLEAEPDREYLIPDDPTKVLGLIDHLNMKAFGDKQFISLAIRRIAEAKGWEIHPF